MEGVRWTNEDDDEEEFIESEDQKESIWEAPEESSWFDSQESESRAEDFLSIVRGEKADEEEESAGDSFMGKLIGEKPEEILEEDDAEAEEQPELTSETPVEEPAELSTEMDQAENQELETEQVIEQEPEPEQEMEPEAEEQPEQTEEEPLVEEQEPADEAAPEQEPQEEIDSLDDYDSEPDSTNEQEDSARDIGVEEEPEEVVEQEEPEPEEPVQAAEESRLSEEEPLEAEETVPAEAEVPIEVDEQVEDGGDDGGEEPPEDDNSRQTSNNQELTSNDSSGRNSEAVNVTHEHAAAGAGLVGVLLGLEHFGRKRADRKLKNRLKVTKKANETDEEFAARMKMIEEEQRIQAQEQDRIDKNQRQADTLRDRHAAEDEEKEVVIQSVTGENFTSENIDKAEEGRERKAGLKLETDIEQSVEEAKMMNQELGGEVGLDSRHESASQRDDGSGLDSDSATSGPTHISEVISTSGINNPGEKDLIINEIIHPPESASEKDAYGHESYMSSVQAGVAIGVIIIIITAVIFFLR